MEELNLTQDDQFNSTSVAAHPINVLLVDDQPALASAMKDILCAAPDIHLSVCHEASRAVSDAASLSATIILQDLNMPGMDGLSLLQQLRANPDTTQIPVVVLSGKNDPSTKAQAFALGAADYIVKLPDRVELIARIRHHAHEHMALNQRNDAFKKLSERERHLTHEMTHAASYVRSLMPAPIVRGHVKIESRFVPSEHLGGDAFGYHWLCHRHLALYMLDVSGHGVGASLLAVNILNTLLHHTLPKVDFHNPSAVLRGLNRVFRMDQHGQHFVTIWYGIYDRADRRLTFASGGHPPPLLLGKSWARNAKPEVLTRGGVPIGINEAVPYQNMQKSIPQHSRLLIYSDGAVEVRVPGVGVADTNAFVDFVANLGGNDNLLDQILNRAKQLRGADVLDDDCSLMQVDFP